MFEALQQIDTVKLNLNSDSSMSFNIAIAFIMFGVALELYPKDFIHLFRKPKPAIVGIFSQFIALPIITFLFVVALGSYITPTVGLGMILVASCPGGNLSNFFSNLARGNLALSIGLTTFSSLTGFILTPFNFSIWGNFYLNYYQQNVSGGLLPELNIPFWDVMQTIIIILGIPLVLGVWFQHQFPGLTAKIVVPIKRLSMFVFLAIVAIALGKDFDNFLTYIGYIFLLVLIHNILALLTGYSLGKLVGLSYQDRKTIAIETGIQNSGLAIALLLDPDIFPKELLIGGMLFIAAWWGIWHIVSGMTIAGIWSGFSVKARTRPVES